MSKSMNDHQVSLDKFNPACPPLCKGRVALNGFVKNCLFCPYALHKTETISCGLKGQKITTVEKYALPAWKELRVQVLSRDGHSCVICSGTEDLHIHHIDADNTHDNLKNLITLCPYCHARAHSERKKAGGRERVIQVIRHCREERAGKNRKNG